ncbi:hypothetical protein OHA25_19345 [Nonomuraea sp. NBC_00507]|uniref:hypothetical protein n=1 Tax=Nonomuraea sp. NBC_00507 TaxID=2976002 RepID=UPI002E17CB2C
MTRIEVRLNGKPVGAATAFTIGRHAHPKARSELPGDTTTSPPAPLTSIDYLRLVDAEHRAAQHQPINYSALLEAHVHETEGERR